MPGLEPGSSRPSMLSECAYHLRYIPLDPSAHTHSIPGTGPCAGLDHPMLTFVKIKPSLDRSLKSLPLKQGSGTIYEEILELYQMQPYFRQQLFGLIS